MSIRMFTIPGYAHLYRSLLRFHDMDSREARELVYMLNTANLDSVRYLRSHKYVRESGYIDFMNSLERLRRRPYRTEVQLYKSLAALKTNILPGALTAEQREAVALLRYIMRSMEFSFYKAFGMQIDDIQTVYPDCAAGLVPDAWEPAVCLMREWVYLPSACN